MPRLSFFFSLILLSFSLTAAISQETRKSPPKDIFEAAAKGSLDDIFFFLDQGVDINAKNADGSAPLHLAAEKRVPSIPQFLIDHGANIHAKDKDGMTPLHFLTKSRMDSLTHRLIQYMLERGADVNAKNDDGWTPLHFVAKNEKTEYIQAMKILVEAGADVNAAANDGITPLHLAMPHVVTAPMKYLVEQGADVDAKDADGLTPMDLADTDEKKEILRQSTGRRAYPNIFLAAARGTVDDIRFFIDQGVDVNARSRPRTPLFIAAAKNPDVEVIKFLFAQGADIQV